MAANRDPKDPHDKILKQDLMDTLSAQKSDMSNDIQGVMKVTNTLTCYKKNKTILFCKCVNQKKGLLED